MKNDIDEKDNSQASLDRIKYKVNIPIEIIDIYHLDIRILQQVSFGAFFKKSIKSIEKKYLL